MPSKNITIGFIPEDNRPVSLAEPQLFCESAKVKLVLPPLNLLGSRFVKAKLPELELWLAENFSKVDAWVIALDMLIYGGLLASRELNSQLDDLSSPLAILSKLKAENPKIKVYCFQSIKRLSVTVQEASDLTIWQDQMALNLSDVQLRIRERNLTINLAAIEAVTKKEIDFLGLLQEDTSPNDLVKNEHAQLLDKIKANHVESKVVLTAGTDEGGLVLLARLINKLQRKNKTKVFIVFTNRKWSSVVSSYEDRSIRSSLNGQLKLINARNVKTIDEADFVLIVWLGEKQQKDLMFSSPEEKLSTEAKSFVTLIKKYLSEKRKVVLADLKYANGADPLFMGLLHKRVALTQLAGFSAWNTTSNALGFALAQGAINLKNKDFLLVRLIEDWGYQGVVRAKLIDYNRKYHDFDIWHLKPEQKIIMENQLQQLLGGWLKKELNEEFVLNTGKKIKFILPWQRLFELEICLI